MIPAILHNGRQKGGIIAMKKSRIQMPYREKRNFMNIFDPSERKDSSRVLINPLTNGGWVMI
jgi:hypothetical protein